MVRVVMGNGAGYGDPLERDPAMVSSDVREGKSLPHRRWPCMGWSSARTAASKDWRQSLSGVIPSDSRCSGVRHPAASPLCRSRRSVAIADDLGVYLPFHLSSFTPMSKRVFSSLSFRTDSIGPEATFLPPLSNNAWVNPGGISSRPMGDQDDVRLPFSGKPRQTR